MLWCIDYNSCVDFIFNKMKNQFEIMKLQTDISQPENSHPKVSKSSTNAQYAIKIENEDSDQDDGHAPNPNEPTHRPIRSRGYGNLLVCRTSNPHLSLGPDYWCFVPAFLAFSAAGLFLIRLVFTTAESPFFKIAALIICIGQPLSYLLVGLSDPGVITMPEAEGGDSKVCTKCEMSVPKHARHCRDCNLCVGHYDHHCPWVSKCIGGNNLIRFYVFLGMTPIYFIFMTVAFVICMGNNVAKVPHLSKTP